MSLHVTDILVKKKARQLWKWFESNDLQYSSLVTLYQAVGKHKIDLIREKKTSFLDVLIDWRFSNPKTAGSLQSNRVRSGIYSALIQKIRVGLMALGKVPLHQISSQILQLGPNFASDDLLRRVCFSNSQYFFVKQSEKGSVVQIAPAKATKGVEEKDRPTTRKNLCESRAKELLKHFYKTQSNIIVALDHGARYKDILLAYEFWDDKVSRDDPGEFMAWLLALAKAKSEESFPKYQKNLDTVLGNRIVDFVKSSSRTIGQITQNLCIGRSRFLTPGMVRGIVLNNPEKMFIADSSNQIEKQFVKVTELGKTFCDKFELTESMEARVKPLLSLRTTRDNVLSNFKILSLDRLMVEKIAKSGCFFNYLVQYAKVHKEKLPSEEFTRHLYSFVRPYLHSALEAAGIEKTGIDTVIYSAPDGLLDATFVRQAAQFFSTEFEVTSENLIVSKTSAQSQEFASLNKEPEAHPIVENPAADLESPGVMHLLAQRPNLGEILGTFLTLSPHSIGILANSSMSFLEWLITLSKRLMPHDAPIFESHLQRLVQQEVTHVHSRQRCQMTVQHVHCLLCAGQPMLLSPNFLSWCLEQPESSFCVYQSWIYLKNNVGCRPKNESLERSTSAEAAAEQKQEFSVDGLLRCLGKCSELSDLHRAIKAVPLECVGFVLQNCVSWYDFLENNLRDRKDREHLSSLLAKEAKHYLQGGVLLTRDLVVILSKGDANFISKDTLEHVLIHWPDTFAVAGTGRDNCKVGTIRQIQGLEVECHNSQEETLLRQILLYFPSSGSSDVSTVLCLIKREDSFLHKKNEMVDEDFLRCFFKMFPMLFCVRGDAVVLTCIALDKKAVYKSALYPTSTTGAEYNEPGSSKQAHSPRESSRKRPRSHSRRDDGKRKRRRSSSKCRQSSRERGGHDVSAEVIVIDESSDQETPVAVNQPKHETVAPLVVDESDGETESLVNVINSLPCELVTDISSSILVRNDGKYPTDDLLIELLFATTGADESQRIQGSTKLLSLFKKKIIELLQQGNPKFVLVQHPSAPGEVIEVKIPQAEDGPVIKPTNVDASEMEKDKMEDNCEPQVGEITSTSETPKRPHHEPFYSPPASPVASDAVTALSPKEDIIKLPESSFEREESGLVPVEKDSAEETRERAGKEGTPSAILASSIEVTIATTTTTTEEKIASPTSRTNAEAAIPMQPLPADSKPAPPSYSYSSSCNAYAKDSPSISISKNESGRSYRENCLKEFFKSYLQISARTCATELLIGSAYRRFQSERFARSALAFEAYVYDFLVKHCHTFVLSGTGTDFGVSKVFYHKGSSSTSPLLLEAQSNLDFLKLERSVCNSSCAYLSTRPNNRSSIEDLCAAIKKEFRGKMVKIPENEINDVVRCLVLVSAIRNLAMFCFAVQEPSVYLRQRKNAEEELNTSHPYQAEIATILQNQKVRKAVLLMARIIETSRPGSQTCLRRLWQAEAPADVSKVFGTGISFTLSIRKYQFVFPTLENGLVSVNEDILATIRNG